MKTKAPALCAFREVVLISASFLSSLFLSSLLFVCVLFRIRVVACLNAGV